MNYTLIIALAGFVGLVATGITFWATYKQGVESSIQTNRMEEKIDKGNKKGEDNYERLSQPLPTELKLQILEFKIKTTEFEKYLPELRRKIKLRLEGRAGLKVISNDELNPELLAMLNNRNVQIYSCVVDEVQLSNPFERGIFSWFLNHRISIENGDQVQFIGNSSGSREYFLITINSNMPMISSNISVSNDVSSAKEISNKNLWFDIRITGKKNITPPEISINHTPLRLKDNLNRNYEINFEGGVKETKIQDKYGDGTLLLGTLKCTSFE